MQTLRANNSRIVTIKNGKFSGYYFYMNLNIWGDFQICISVPLSTNKLVLQAINENFIFDVFTISILSRYLQNKDFFI